MTQSALPRRRNSRTLRRLDRGAARWFSPGTGRRFGRDAARRFARGAARRFARGAALAIALPWLVAWSFFDPFHEKVEKGNRAAEEGSPTEAVEQYDEADALNPSSPIPDFNRGLAYAAQGEAEAARDAFRGAAATTDPAVAADAWYNLGNVHLGAQEFEPAILAYLSSLDLDPDDPDARRNLEIATQMLEQQQQQQQQQPQDQESSDDENEDEQPPSDQQQPDDQPDDSSDEAPPEEQPSEPEEEQPQRSEERLSREDAERLLNAIQSDELKVLEELQDQQEGQAVVEYDW
jgi:tetratricopeptide (TPR) repeat protein